MLQQLNETTVQSEDAVPPHGLLQVKPESAIEATVSGDHGRSQTESERELIDLARQGDTAAFGELIKQNYRGCLKRASALIRNPDDAQDEVQNACWKAFERFSQFRGEGSFSAWLGRIVENQCLM